MSAMNNNTKLVLAAAVLLAGCTINGDTRVEGWPKLKTVEHYVSTVAMFDQCQKYAPWGSVVEACAEFDLTLGVCNIYYSKDFPPSQRVIDHEREHCEGYDHIGGTELQMLLNARNRELGR